MIDLTELINTEEQKNNGLRQVLENDGKFPSEEVAKAIGAKDLYRIASDTVEFGIKIRLKLLQSNYYLVELMKSAIKDPHQNVMGLDKLELQKMADNYLTDNERLTNGIIDAFMKGYEASW